MINLEHAKRVLAHQEDVQLSEQQNLILEMAERLISIENRLSRTEVKMRERMDDFLRGMTNLSIRFDRLEAKLNKGE